MNPTIQHVQCPVESVREVAANVFVLRFTCPSFARSVLAGQFLNVRVSEGFDPLLRRPFSVYRTDGDSMEIIFNVVGRGTTMLSQKKKGETIDVIGPLGVPFNLARPDYQTAILVGGGLGVAPLPLATRGAREAGKAVQTFLGARSKGQLAESHLENLSVATDDGSRGFHGTVVELLESSLAKQKPASPKIFACGPTAMLRALAAYALKAEIPCEVSLEGPMACGIGLCQGCPVELVDGPKKFALMCTEGPTFDVRKIRL